MREVRKRDGRIVPFDRKKIEYAIFRCLEACGYAANPTQYSELLANKVCERLSSLFPEESKVLDIEAIQDAVERVLIDVGEHEYARRYIEYRLRKAEERRIREVLGVKDELKLPVEGLSLLKDRYLLRDSDGAVTETPSQLFQRVAKAVAKAEEKDRELWAERFFSLLGGQGRIFFLPNSPVLFNAGTPMGQLSACFVIPIPDSINGISRALWDMARVQQTGGGTGFDFSLLRQKGDLVKSTNGTASGPISFMRVFNEYTEQIKQGGRRRGANIGLLDVTHPDIMEFITCKASGTVFNNFNISVKVTDSFMEKVTQPDALVELISPRTKLVIHSLPAKEIWWEIVKQAWKTGDPGLIFIDTINRANFLPKLGRIEATNPCGEQPLLPYESCVLGSLNLTEFVENGKWNDVLLREKVPQAVRFLDDVITVNRYPTKEIKAATLRTRKIGLGVMGFHDALLEMGIPYDSEEGRNSARQVMRTILNLAEEASSKLAEEKGVFPAFSDSYWNEHNQQMRNASITTIAPTGTICLLAGVSSGIEPNEAFYWRRKVVGSLDIEKFHPLLQRELEKRELTELLPKIKVKGTLSGIQDERIKDLLPLYKSALEINPLDHIKMQATFQTYIHSAVSKTVNLPQSSTPEDISEIFYTAWKLGCKGITIYRDKSRTEQVIYVGDGSE